MKSVLISIQPKWCELIASGKKTIEVRKTRPKIDTPFKCYIYCTSSNVHDCLMVNESGTKRVATINYKTAIPCGGYIGNGKVIGEFVCDRIDYVRNYGDMVDSYDCIASCLSANEIIEYAKDKNGNFVYTYGWHISDLVIYDKPKELSEFYVNEKTNCPAYLNGICLNRKQNDVIRCENLDCQHKKLTRPPQSWCYIEHMGEKGR